jgi:Ca2+-transporting ATPase
VVLFGVLGFTQEYRAEKAMAALRKMAVPNVRVRRDGEVREVAASQLVPGDIVLLEAGNVVPADARIVESNNLRIQEAALTGESEPIEKETGALSGENLPLGDRRNMGFMGTNVTYGRGVAVVVETGMNTELGHIATLIQEVDNEMTPLQKRLDQLGKALGVAALVIAALIFVLGIIDGEPVELMFMTAVSIAVAAVPEGLPAVVTITLALGAKRMLRRQSASCRRSRHSVYDGDLLNKTAHRKSHDGDGADVQVIAWSKTEELAARHAAARWRRTAGAAVVSAVADRRIAVQR